MPGPVRTVGSQPSARALAIASRALIRQVAGLHPSRLAVLGYLSHLLAGWLLLCLPFAHVRSEGGLALDHLFTAASALTTTGLVTVSLADQYTFFGQLVVLLLIQAGGVGYMTFGSFVVLSTGAHLSTTRTNIGKTVFSLPESFEIEKFVFSVVAFTIIIETIGAIALYSVFVEANVPAPLWSAIFHSVSAFCTAGFSLYNTSLEAFADNFWLNAVVAVLSLSGAIGFIVFVDCWRWIRGKIEHITLTSKIILASSFWLIVGATLLLFINEPAIQGAPAEQRLLTAFFQAMTALTTVGFNTVPIGALSKGSILLLTVLMVIGASPSGTGGGLKSTTCSAVWGVMKSTFRGDEQVRFRGRPIPAARIHAAIASVGLYFILLIAGTYLLELTQAAEFEQNLFEAASALGTVGLSMGITAALTPLGKVVIIFLMFAGRLGPLTFGMALFFRMPDDDPAQDQDLAV